MATATSPGPAPVLRLLGGFDLRLGAEPIPLPTRAQRVLAYLALQNRPLARSYVAGNLWLDASEQHAQGNLRAALWRLGRSGVPLVDAAPGRLAIHPGVAVDVHRSASLASDLAVREAQPAVAGLPEAHLSEDVLPDWGEDWVVEARERHRQLRLHALELLCDRLIHSGSYSRAVQAGLAAVAGEPLRESAQRALIMAYLAEGNLSEARRQYCEYRAVLEESIGLQPSAAVARLVGL